MLIHPMIECTSLIEEVLQVGLPQVSTNACFPTIYCILLAPPDLYPCASPLQWNHHGISRPRRRKGCCRATDPEDPGQRSIFQFETC